MRPRESPQGYSIMGNHSAGTKKTNRKDLIESGIFWAFEVFLAGSCVRPFDLSGEGVQ
jgi:hypothetical protein